MPRGASKRAPQFFHQGTCLGVRYRRAAHDCSIYCTVAAHELFIEEGLKIIILITTNNFYLAIYCIIAKYQGRRQNLGSGKRNVQQNITQQNL